MEIIQFPAGNREKYHGTYGYTKKPRAFALGVPSKPLYHKMLLNIKIGSPGVTVIELFPRLGLR